MSKINFVNLKKQYSKLKVEIDNAIQEVINDTAFINGKYVNAFERQFEQKYGMKNCVSCANGTDALYIALKTLQIGTGDEVITVANTWISTSETISQTGAKVVFVDINKKDFNIDVNKIEEKITTDTKAIIAVHLYGQAANLTMIEKICKKYNLFLIEDCAQAHFAEHNNIRVGTVGDIATFSFYPGKNLGAYGDAGAIITNNSDLAQSMRMYARHGALTKHKHKIEGINSRMDGIQAAILSVKLKYIDEWNVIRLKNALLYNEKLKTIKEVEVPFIIPNSKHVFHVYCIRAQKRDELMRFLNSSGIETAIHYPTALPFTEAYSYLKHTKTDFPIAHNYQSEILSLPMCGELNEREIDIVVSKIKEFYNY